MERRTERIGRVQTGGLEGVAENKYREEGKAKFKRYQKAIWEDRSWEEKEG